MWSRLPRSSAHERTRTHPRLPEDPDARLPLRPQLDEAFVDELIADFHDLDILEEAKTFRWYYNNCPASRLKNLRAGLRRWIENSRCRKPA